MLVLESKLSEAIALNEILGKTYLSEVGMLVGEDITEI